MKYRFEAEDLLERIEMHQSVLKREQLIEMIDDTMCQIVQDHINAEVFRGMESGNLKQELQILLNKAEEFAKKTQEYIEASYFCSGDLSHKTEEQQYLAAQLNLIDCGRDIQTLVFKISFIKKQLNLE